MKPIRVFITISLLCITHSAVAGTTLDFWHSYTHARTREHHYGFHLTQFKRGIFWGSCGPSTKSLQWCFTFDLAGDGPRYDVKRIALSDDNGNSVRVASGEITTTPKCSSCKIALQIETAGRTNQFIGNGEYRIHKTR